MDKVSDIIPTYNRAKTLLVAVESALNQTYAVHEIIVCDDGSTDRSEEMIQKLKQPNVKWLNCGRPAANRQMIPEFREADYEHSAC